ncbi:CvpA family protein [Apilactobacillus ozensis]|uniref:CvpA family protein n=1 Tax=Apilactobacillus ozensis TaxID=866801 RepID=UPI000AEEBD21
MIRKVKNDFKFNNMDILNFFYLVRGYKLGLVHELLTLVGYLISWVIALIYANDFTNFIKIDKITSNHMLSNAISFFIIFILMWILVRWIKNFF